MCIVCAHVLHRMKQDKIIDEELHTHYANKVMDEIVQELAGENQVQRVLVSAFLLRIILEQHNSAQGVAQSSPASQTSAITPEMHEAMEKAVREKKLN